MKWEYLTEKIVAEEFQAILDTRGENGWELVGFLWTGEFYRLVFKMPLKE